MDHAHILTIIAFINKEFNQILTKLRRLYCMVNLSSRIFYQFIFHSSP